MKVVEGASKEPRLVIRCEASFIDRLDRVAEEFYGGNRSEMIRRVLDGFLELREPELSSTERSEEVRAA